MSDMDRAAVLRQAILGELRAADTQSRKELGESLAPGDKRTVWDGDTDLGHVLKTKPTLAWKVIDEAAFVRWVMDHHPDSIEVTYSVDERWQAAVLKTGKASEVDPETGEVVEVTPPGVALVKGASQLRVVASDEGKALASSILRGTPVLGAGDE